MPLEKERRDTEISSASEIEFSKAEKLSLKKQAPSLITCPARMCRIPPAG